MTSLVVAALALGAGAAAGADAELDARAAAWAENGPTSYRYAYQKFCECHREEPPVTWVEVVDGQVTDVYHVHANSDRRVPARDGSLDLYRTIPELFALAASADAQAVPYRIRYDSELGYPLHVYVDYDTAMVGEEIDIRLTDFIARP